MLFNPYVKTVIENCEARKHFRLQVALDDAAIANCISFREAQFFGETDSNKQDREPRDKFAIHLQIVDQRHNLMVGYLRLMSNTFLKTPPASLNYYSTEFYQLDAVNQAFANGLEISRFCVLSEYRKQPAIFLLIRQAIIQLINHFNIDGLFGLASFEQASFEKHQSALRFLAARNLVTLKTSTTLEINTSHPAALDTYSLLDSDPTDGDCPPTLPPLLRFYLNFSPVFSRFCVLDTYFNSTLLFLYVSSANLQK